MQIQSKYDVIIVGGGVYGLSIAYYLSKNQDLKIALLQQYAIGHNKGSSHSTTRITRSIYEKQLYRDLNMSCLNNNWKEMQQKLKVKLIYPNEFIYFIDDELNYQNYKKQSQKSSKQNVLICQSIQQYKQYFKGRKYPQIESKYPPIIDKKAGIIYSALYIKKLQQYLSTQCQNVTIIQHTEVKSIQQNQKQISVETQTDILRASKVVLACGKWIKQMAPEISNLFTVVKQYVSFVQLQHPFEFTAENYPSFAYLQKNGKLFYSAPDDTIQKLGVKLAQHRNKDKQNPHENTIQFNYQQYRKKSLEYFGQDFISIKSVQQCVYTITKSQDFVIDWIGSSEKILVSSCCSGHGFKFAPAIGQIISKIVENSFDKDQGQKDGNKNRNVNPIYQKWQHMFKIPYHKGINLV